MKFCTSCGQGNSDEATFCASCGAKFADESNQAQTSSAPPQNGNGVNPDLTKRGSFVSEDEYVVATLSNDMITNVLSGEGLKTEGAVLTNKRVYYRHTKGIMNIRTQEEIVDIKDITGTKIANLNPVGVLILSILIAFVGIFLASNARYDGIVYFLYALVPAIGLLATYFIVKKSHLRLEYAGGSIYFSVKKYGKEKIHHFQKSIHAIKDQIDHQNK